jgi:hypothetical protein
MDFVDKIDLNGNNSDSDEGEEEERHSDDGDLNTSELVLTSPETTGYFISRRMSGLPLMSPIMPKNAVTDQTVLKDLSVLLAKFPDPPTEEAIEHHRASSAAKDSNSQSKGTTWSGIKGLAASFWK